MPIAEGLVAPAILLSPMFAASTPPAWSLFLTMPVAIKRILPLTRAGVVTKQGPVYVTSILPFTVYLRLSDDSVLQPKFVVLPVLGCPGEWLVP